MKDIKKDVENLIVFVNDMKCLRQFQKDTILKGLDIILKATQFFEVDCVIEIIKQFSLSEQYKYIHWEMLSIIANHLYRVEESKLGAI